MHMNVLIKIKNTLVTLRIPLSESQINEFGFMANKSGRKKTVQYTQ